MEEQNNDFLNYKIRAGVKYKIFKTTVNEKNFYKIGISQRNHDGTTSQFYKEVKFKRGIDLPNKTDIIIRQGYENLRYNPLDKYNPISYLMITDFEEVRNQAVIQRKAEEEFRDNLYANDEVSISDDFLD